MPKPFTFPNLNIDLTLKSREASNYSYLCCMEISTILQKLQIEHLNSMQEEVLRQFRAHQDFMLLAPTGSGKTLAFALLVARLVEEKKNSCQCLIVVPTRELALQIERVIRSVMEGHKVVCVYGGNDSRLEKNKLKDAPTVLIGTPGRIIYHIEKEHFSTKHIHTVVLDEFDKSLELGFQEQLKFILEACAQTRQKILTSATFHEELPDFVTLRQVITVNRLVSHENQPDLHFLKVISPAQHKLKALFNLLCQLEDKKVLIFCNHRDAVDHISELLDDRGIIHDVFHGGLEQRDRELAILKFRNNSNRILLTTDLAARGLDIPEIDVIIHYQLPTKEDAFIHRNGRTARMHATGEVIVLLKPDDIFPYLPEGAEELHIQHDLPLPPNTSFCTLYVPLGKKHKVNKIDFVGYILKIEGISKDDLGLIEVKDKESYIAVRRNLATKIIQEGSNGKIKGNKVKFSRT